MNKTEVTPDQIEQWKREHGKVFVASADGHKAYYRKPTRKDLSYAMTLKNQPLEVDEAILRNCFLGGEPFHEDLDCLLGLESLVGQMITVKRIEVGEA